MRIHPGRWLLTLGAAAALLSGCGAGTVAPAAKQAAPTLSGAWRSQVRFSSGPFASVKDLEFMYVVHPDGTLTESSNYDAAPPVPPAYGVWRAAGPGRFQLHYEFYVTAAPKAGASLSNGWAPSGRGLLDETVTLAADGESFRSQLRLTMLDAQGKPTGDGGEAVGAGERIGF